MVKECRSKEGVVPIATYTYITLMLYVHIRTLSLIPISQAIMAAWVKEYRMEGVVPAYVVAYITVTYIAL